MQTSQCSFHIFRLFPSKSHAVHVQLRRGCFEPFYTKALVTSPHRNLNRPETENCLLYWKLQVSRTTLLQLRWDHRNAVKARVVQSLSRSEINDNLSRQAVQKLTWRAASKKNIRKQAIGMSRQFMPFVSFCIGFLFWMDGLPFRGMLCPNGSWNCTQWCQGAFRFGAFQAA